MKLKGKHRPAPLDHSPACKATVMQKPGGVLKVKTFKPGWNYNKPLGK